MYRTNSQYRGSCLTKLRLSCARVEAVWSAFISQMWSDKLNRISRNELKVMARPGQHQQIVREVRGFPEYQKGSRDGAESWVQEDTATNFKRQARGNAKQWCLHMKRR